MGQIRLATLTKLQKNVEKVSTTPKKPKKKKLSLGGHLPLRPRGVAVSVVSFYFWANRVFYPY